MKILVLFYSSYGHVFKMAERVAAGARQVEGAVVVLKQVPETLSNELQAALGILDARKAFAHIPYCTVDELAGYDAILFGTPTRFGNMCAQMRAFLDASGGLWASGALIGKVGSVFVSTATQHGGQESTILSFHTTLLHHGMLIAGLPYSFAGQGSIAEITGCSPYGASTIAGMQGERMPSENELAGAEFQGKYVAEIASRLKK